MKLIPYLSFKENDFVLNVFDDLFYEEAKDLQTGLYLIGDGCASVYFHFVDEELTFLPPRKNSFMFEVNLYATPETLDLPVIKRDRGILAYLGCDRVFYSMMQSSARRYGASLWETLLVPNQIEKGIKNVLDDENNRRNMGLEVLEELEEMGLSRILKNYRREEKKVIPFV